MFGGSFFAGLRDSAIAKAAALAEAAKIKAAAEALREWCKTGVVVATPLPANYPDRIDFCVGKIPLCPVCGTRASKIGCCYFNVQTNLAPKRARSAKYASMVEMQKVYGDHMPEWKYLLLEVADKCREHGMEIQNTMRDVDISADAEIMAHIRYNWTTVCYFHRSKERCTKEQWMRAAMAYKLMFPMRQLFYADDGYPLIGWQQLPASIYAHDIIMSLYCANKFGGKSHEYVAECSSGSNVNWLDDLYHYRMPVPYKQTATRGRAKVQPSVEKISDFNLDDYQRLESALSALGKDAENLVRPEIEESPLQFEGERKSGIYPNAWLMIFFRLISKLTLSFEKFVDMMAKIIFLSPMPDFSVEAAAMGVNEITDVSQFDVNTLPTTLEFLKLVREKPKLLGNGSLLDQGGDSRLSTAKEREFRKDDIFHKLSFGERFNTNRFISQWINPDGHYSLPINEFTISSELVKYPGCDEQGVPKAVFVTLTRPMASNIRKVLENGWVEYRAAACSIKITSHVALGTNVQALLVFQQANSSDPLESALSSARVDLSKQKGAMLTLPMINLSLKYAGEDYEAWKMMLQIQVTIIGGKGLRIGTPILSLACMEFGELVPNSFTGVTHERESWQAILAKSDNSRPLRFQSTLNVLETLEKECSEEIEGLNSIIIRPPLCNETVVRTFDSKAKVTTTMPRSLSTRLNFKKIEAVQNNLMAPRMSLSHASAMGISDVESTISYNKVTIPSSQKIGAILSTFNVINDARAFNSKLYNKWQLQGYMDANLKVYWAGALNSFTGNAYYIACDAFGRVPKTATTLPKDIFVQLPGWLVVSRDSSTFEHTFNIREIVGHNFYVGKESIAQLNFVVFSASNSQLELSAASFATIIVHALDVEMECSTFATESYLEYPLQPSALNELNWYLPIETARAGELNNRSYSLSLGSPKQNGTKDVYSHQAAMLNHFLGYGGTIRARIIVVSSAFVNVCFSVYCYHTVATMPVITKIPHEIAWTGVDFSFKIMSPYFAVSTRGNSDSYIHFWPLSGVEAPKAHKSDLDMYLLIKGIDVEMRLVKSINYTNAFAWFSIKAVEPLKEEVPLIFKITNFFGDFALISEGLTVKNYVNPFSLLCAASGMHYGNVKLHFNFSHSHATLKDLEARTIITSGFGPEDEVQHGMINHFSMIENHAVVPFEFSTFVGPTPSSELTEYSNWVVFSSDAWHQFDSLAVSVEVVPGFRFYGKTCTPLE